MIFSSKITYFFFFLKKNNFQQVDDVMAGDWLPLFSLFVKKIRERVLITCNLYLYLNNY